jgi:hypothetical protein
MQCYPRKGERCRQPWLIVAPSLVILKPPMVLTSPSNRDDGYGVMGQSDKTVLTGFHPFPHRCEKGRRAESHSTPASRRASGDTLLVSGFGVCEPRLARLPIGALRFDGEADRGLHSLLEKTATGARNCLRKKALGSLPHKRF